MPQETNKKPRKKRVVVKKYNDTETLIGKLQALTGWNQEALSRELGVSQATVSRWLSGKQELLPSHVILISTLIEKKGETADKK